MPVFHNHIVPAAEKRIMLYWLLILSGILLWISITFYALYIKVDAQVAHTIKTSNFLLPEGELYHNELFIDTYTAIHDPTFFDHSGFVLTQDFKTTFQKKFGDSSPGNNTSLTRYLSKHAAFQGIFAGFFQQYLFPLAVEERMDKPEILKISIVLRQNKAGISYDEITEYLRLKNSKEYSHYHWLLLHSIFDSFYNDKKEQYAVEDRFFENLTQLYSNGVIEDSDLDEIYLRYRNDFLFDLSLFYQNYRLKQNFNSIPDKSIGKYGGAVIYIELASHYAKLHGISTPLFMAIIQSESNGDPNAVSRMGALGLAQIMPATARDVTNNPHFNSEKLFEPEINLEIAARYIKIIEGWVDNAYPELDQEKRVDLIASAYNAGWSRVKRANGIPNILETRNYVQRVQHYYSLYSNSSAFTQKSITKLR